MFICKYETPYFLWDYGFPEHKKSQQGSPMIIIFEYFL